MALKGNLKDFSLTQLLNLINLARKTGVLHLQHPPAATAKLFFREGRLVDAALNGQAPDLTTLLFRIGKISADQQRTILGHATVRTDKEIALLLINSGHVTQTDIVQSVRASLLDAVYLLFTWADGNFFFESGTLPAEDRITVPINLEAVIMEGTRRVQEWEMLQDELPDLDMAMKFTERPNTNLRDISLSVEEWRVISFINPRNSIRQIADVNKMNEFQIRKIVYRMMSAGLVELLHPEGAAPKRLLTRPAAAPEPAARPPVGAPSRLAPATAAASAPTTAPAAAPQQAAGPVNRNIIMRLINRIRQL
ncbi:MAG: DUF4388 domain-containing protein [Chloroflexi bacterium]|nr:DUF4388 domain-containing protein [Chloroflexota bacterium]